MHQGEPNDHIDEFIDRCRRYRLKITPQRIAIFRELLHSDSHPTADAVHRGVVAQHPSISFDTVNRTLATFVKIGIVDVVEGFGGAKRFDTDVSGHHHLHCILCGRIFDFKNAAYDSLAVPEKIEKQFQVVGKRVVLKGICKDCRSK
jgi:Fur family peroxide stress response transcriptional regulator